jgi:hypothetical protein
MNSWPVSAWRCYRGMLESMFLRYYSSSLARPWINSPEGANYDAVYRMSVVVTAPFVLLTLLLGLVLIHADPNGLFSRHRPALMGGGFGISTIAVYLLLRRTFGDRVVPSSNGDGETGWGPGWILEIVGWPCVVGYIVAAASATNIV